jgi:hypothetical protein
MTAEKDIEELLNNKPLSGAWGVLAIGLPLPLFELAKKENILEYVDNRWYYSNIFIVHTEVAVTIRRLK